MKKRKHLVALQKSFLVVLVLCITCNSVVAQSDAYPLAKSLRKIDLTPGLRSQPIPMSDGTELSSLVYLPASDSFDLILGLHWAVMANANLEFVNCLLLPSMEQDDYMLIAPLADYQYWWNSPRDKQLIKIIKLARKHLPVKKVYVIGYSDGGTGSLHLLNNYPKQIDGIVAIAASHSGPLNAEVPAVVIHGTEDDLYKFNEVDSYMKNNPSDQIHYIVAEGKAHYEACLYVDDLRKGLEWLQSQ